MAKHQRNKAVLRIERGLELRQYERDAIEFDLYGDEDMSGSLKKLGTLSISGANVYFRHGRSTVNWKTISDFVSLLKREM